MSHDHVTMTVGCVSSDSGAALIDVRLDSKQEVHWLFWINAVERGHGSCRNCAHQL